MLRRADEAQVLSARLRAPVPVPAAEVRAVPWRWLGWPWRQVYCRDFVHALVPRGATRALHVVPPPGFEPPISLRAARPAAAATIALTPRARLRARAAARWRRASTSGRGGAGRGPANRGSASRNPPPELFLLLLLSSSSPPLHGVERPNGPPGVALPKPELCRDDELKGSERRDPSTRPVHCPAESDGRDSS